MKCTETWFIRECKHHNVYCESYEGQCRYCPYHTDEAVKKAEESYERAAAAYYKQKEEKKQMKLAKKKEKKEARKQFFSKLLKRK